MRLIDADELFNWGKHKLSDATKYGNKGADQTSFSYCTLMMYEIADEISDAPTVDAAPVVRCYECRKWHTPDCHAGHEQCAADYCSHGIKKERKL